MSNNLGKPLEGTIDDLFPKQWLQIRDLRDDFDGDADFTIQHVTEEQTYLKRTNSHTTVYALWFHETPKALILNQTNGTIIADIHTRHLLSWSNQRVNLYIEDHVFNPNTGKKGPAIRVRQAHAAAPPPNTDKITPAQLQEIHDRGARVYNGQWNQKWPQAWINHFCSNIENATMNDLTQSQAAGILNGLRERESTEAAAQNSAPPPAKGDPQEPHARGNGQPQAQDDALNHQPPPTQQPTTGATK